MNSRVSNNTLFSYLFSTCFKLWLDKTNHFSVILKKCLSRTKNLCKTDK